MLLERSKDPLYLSRRTIGMPFNENALVFFNGQDSHLDGDTIHLPIPLDLLALFQPSTTPGKPEFGGDARIDKRLKYVCNGSANQHFRFCEWGLRELKIFHHELLSLYKRCDRTARDSRLCSNEPSLPAWMCHPSPRVWSSTRDSTMIVYMLLPLETSPILLLSCRQSQVSMLHPGVDA